MHYVCLVQSNIKQAQKIQHILHLGLVNVSAKLKHKPKISIIIRDLCDSVDITVTSI